MARALIAEDDAVTRHLLASIIEPYLETRAVANGQDALDAYFQALKTDNPFEILILDISMPKADGLQVLGAVREHEEKSGIPREKWVKAFIVSGSTDGNDIFDANLLNSDSYIVKPINRESLLKSFTKAGIILDH